MLGFALLDEMVDASYSRSGIRKKNKNPYFSDNVIVLRMLNSMPNLEYEFKLN